MPDEEGARCPCWARCLATLEAAESAVGVPAAGRTWQLENEAALANSEKNHAAAVAALHATIGQMKERTYDTMNKLNRQLAEAEQERNGVLVQC